MAHLVVRLLGGYRVELGGEAVYSFETGKARALLAYLIVEADRPHRRETLAALLWPDRPESVARANLRQTLSRLRRALSDREPPFFLFVTPTDVQFNTASDHRLDVAELEAFASLPVRRSELLPAALCSDFLAGFAVPDSEVFQSWVLSKQEYYHRLGIEILDEQILHFEGIGAHEKAAAAARLQLELEPWLEEAHRSCMRALALAGRSDEALRQYESCRRVLDSELGAEPALATQALYADIRAGKSLARGAVARTHSSGPLSPPSPADLGRPGLLGGQSGPPGEPAPPAGSPGGLVGREDELGQLVRHLDAALAGETQVVFIGGERGSGKTALLEAFAGAAMAQNPDLLVAGARCSPGGSLDPLAPLRRLAEMLFGGPGADVAWRMPDREQADRLRSATNLLLSSLVEHGGGLVDALVSAASVARRASLSPGGAARARPAWWDTWRAGLEKAAKPSVPLSQGALFDQLLRTLAAIAHGQPLLLLFDDLQWVDGASVAFLLRLGLELAGGRLLVLGAYRSATVAIGRREPGSGEVVRHPLAAAINELRRRRGEITVDLDRTDGRAFVEAYVDAEPNRLGARFRDALYAQTGGHALFTVETLRNLQERGMLFRDEVGRWAPHESLDWEALPARVEAAIAERIERLPEALRRTLSCASVEGDEFSAEVLAEVTRTPIQDIVASLSGSLTRQHRLVRPEALRRLPYGQRSVYRFTHHLFQKYLYDQLDPVERGKLHEAVGLSLEGLHGAQAGELSVELARHFEAAGRSDKAARCSLQAGKRAMEVSAHPEAVEYFRHGLTLLADLVDSPERDRDELDLQLALGSALLTTEGMGSQGQILAYSRAYELSRRLGERAELWPALHALASSSTARGQYQKALELGEQLLALAERANGAAVLALAHFTLGATYFSSGISLPGAREHLERAIRCYDDHSDAEFASSSHLAQSVRPGCQRPGLAGGCALDPGLSRPSAQAQSGGAGDG